jgi:hypothetical protein
MLTAMLLAITSLAIAAVVSVGMRDIYQKHLYIWVGEFFRRRRYLRKIMNSVSPSLDRHILFCLVDHFEPISAGSTRDEERARIQDWLKRYPILARKHRDSDGVAPQHTWFYPCEKYDSEYLDNLVSLCRQHLGEIELHLHHGNDTAATLKARICDAIEAFGKHGALVTQGAQSIHAYGFIHGNMALDNSMNDAALCGVNNEISILAETGCYADFSMPTAPGISQSRRVNAVYYAKDKPDEPKSHDWGIEVESGGQASDDLMIIPGPLAFDVQRRKWGIIPRIENAELQGSNPPTEDRIRNWVRQGIHVKGRPEWIIVKISCHGAEDRSRDVILGDIADRMYSCLEREYRDKRGVSLHYVTARELYNIIKAAESGKGGNPGEYRNFKIPPYRTHEDVRTLDDSNKAAAI